MIQKDNFFKGHFNNSKQYNKNFKRVQNIFSDFVLEIENGDVPLLESLKKEYKFDFTSQMVKKFSRYKS